MNIRRRIFALFLLVLWAFSAVALAYFINMQPARSAEVLEESLLNALAIQIESPSAANKAFVSKFADTTKADLESAMKQVAWPIYLSLAGAICFPIALLFVLFTAILQLQGNQLPLPQHAVEHPAAEAETVETATLAFEAWLQTDSPEPASALGKFCRIHSIPMCIYYACHNAIQPMHAFGVPLYKTHPYNMGEGLPGEAVASQKAIFLEAPHGFAADIASGLGSTPPHTLCFLPIERQGRVEALLEVGTFGALTAARRRAMQHDAQLLGAFMLGNP